MQLLWMCWPRTGSTWAASALGNLLEWPFREAIRAGTDVVIRNHWTASQKEQIVGGMPHKVILGIRDPRDVVVSHYYMLLRNNPAFTVANLSLQQYVERYFVRERTPDVVWVGDAGLPACSWAQFYREWIEANPDVRVRHKDLMADRAGELSRILKVLGLEAKVSMGTVVAKYAGYTRPVYNEGYTRRNDSGQIIPRGQPHWREYLGLEELGLIYDSCGTLMHYCGYEWEPV